MKNKIRKFIRLIWKTPEQFPTQINIIETIHYNIYDEEMRKEYNIYWRKKHWWLNKYNKWKAVVDAYGFSLQFKSLEEAKKYMKEYITVSKKKINNYIPEYYEEEQFQ